MEYLTLKQASRELDLTYAALRRDVEKGRLPAYRVGRKYFLARAEAEAYAQAQQKNSAEDCYTIREIMEILPLSYAFLIELIHAGRLPAHKDGRRYLVRKEDLQAFLRAAEQ